MNRQAKKADVSSTPSQNQRIRGAPAELAGAPKKIVLKINIYKTEYLGNYVRVKGYSSVPNKSVGWNNHVGEKIMSKLINLLDGINVLIGKTLKYNKCAVGKMFAKELRKFKLVYFTLKSL